MSDPFSDLVPVRDFFASVGVPFWFAGGWAIDLFVGYQTRPHEDVDVLILDRDAEALRPLYTAGQLRLTRAHQMGRWEPGQPLEPGPDLLEPSPGVVGSLQDVHVVLGLTRGDEWVYHRGSQSITWPIASLGEVRDGLPYLAPVAALVFHARLAQPKGEHAFDVVAPHLDAGQRDWLLARLPEGHRWRSRLTA